MGVCWAMQAPSHAGFSSPVLVKVILQIQMPLVQGLIRDLFCAWAEDRGGLVLNEKSDKGR